MPWQEDTISHAGQTLGEEAVDVRQNQPDNRDVVASFECPEQYDRLSYVGARDPTRFVPRTMQSATVSDDDGDGSLSDDERTIALDNNIQPVAGETDLLEQDYPAVEAVNVTQGTEIALEDLTVDYATNSVTVADSAVASGDDVKVYPILTEGTIKWQGKNVLDQNVGRLYEWAFPVYRFHDMEQDKRGTEIRLRGRSAEWKRHESLQLTLESPHSIVWTDADYPGAYVSTLEQDVEILV